MASAASVTSFGSWLRVTLASGEHADFHARWLRHACDQDRHPLTRERTLDSCELPDDLSIREARIDGGALEVLWSHGERRSRYLLSWLSEHAYAHNRQAVPPPPSDVAAIELAWAGSDPTPMVASALERVWRCGAVVVRRQAPAPSPADETERLIDAFAAAGLQIIGTHFGRIEDLRTDNTTNQNTDQLGYTDAAIDLHTDQPFLDEPPRLQLLQAVRQANEGGENRLVDAQAAAAYLGLLDAHALDLLRSVPVHFHRRQKAFERLVVSPILSGEGATFRVRHSYFTMAPHRIDFARMEDFYRAYDRFGRLIREPQHQVRFLLSPGDFVVYDNHRMLHARTGFRGARWLRGIYFNPA